MNVQEATYKCIITHNASHTYNLTGSHRLLCVNMDYTLPLYISKKIWFRENMWLKHMNRLIIDTVFF